MKTINHNRLDQVVLDARKAADTRAEGYRERALKINPDRGYTDSSKRGGGATHNPFAALQSLLKKD